MARSLDPVLDLGLRLGWVPSLDLGLVPSLGLGLGQVQPWGQVPVPVQDQGHGLVRVLKRVLKPVLMLDPGPGQDLQAVKDQDTGQAMAGEVATENMHWW